MNPAPPVTKSLMWAKTLTAEAAGLSRAAVGGEAHDVLPVRRLPELLAEAVQLLALDVAHPPGDLLDAGDLLALPVLEDLHERRRLQQRVVRAGVEPRHAPAELDQPRRPVLDVPVVEVGDLELAAG